MPWVVLIARDHFQLDVCSNTHKNGPVRKVRIDRSSITKFEPGRASCCLELEIECRYLVFCFGQLTIHCSYAVSLTSLTCKSGSCHECSYGSLLSMVRSAIL